jgi:sialidase-1
MKTAHMTTGLGHIESLDLFTAGTEDCCVYRVPALAVSKTDVLLAFCEGRRSGRSDSGRIDILLKRSLDGGRTWQPTQLVGSDEDATCTNPSPVVDRDTGNVLLLFCKHPAAVRSALILEGKAPRTVWLTVSEDNGASWSRPREITASVKNPHWTWYVTGPGHGIQLRNGRIVIPCNHVVGLNCNARDPGRAHVIYSDDRGQTWSIGGTVGDATRQSTVVQTGTGELYLNCRTGKGLCKRACAWSLDNGRTFGLCRIDSTLTDPVEGLGCHASVLRLTEAEAEDRNRVLFSNPAGREKRERLSIRISYDECRSWNPGRTLFDGCSAYSDLVRMPDCSIGCLYENGHNNAFERLTFAQFDLTWLTHGTDRISHVGSLPLQR